MPRIAFFLTIAAFFLAAAAPAQTTRPALPELLSDADHENWRAIGRVNVGGFRSRSLCTGTLVAIDLVLTAAHCVMINGKTYPPEQVQFVAGWLKGGFVAHRKGAALIFPDGAADGTPGRDTDVALIRLANPISAAAATPLPFGTFAATEPPLALIAYRRDRPHALGGQYDCQPLSKTDTLIGLSCDVASGNSGGPVLGKINGDWHIIAVMSARVNRNQWIRSLAVIPGEDLRTAIDDN